MKTPKLKRLSIIYYIMMLLVLSIFCVNTYNFSMGFSEGMQMTKKGCDNNEGQKIFNGYYNIGLDHQQDLPFSIALPSHSDSSCVVLARPSGLDISIQSNNFNSIFSPRGILSSILAFMMIFCYLGIFVLVIIMFRSIKKCIAQDSMFVEKNIKLMRTIGYLMIASTLMGDIFTWNHLQTAEYYLQGSPYQVLGGFDIISFKEILMGVIILFMAEISSIARRLEEDQQFTI